MPPTDGEFRIDRFSSDDIPAPDRLAFTREVYGRTIIKHDIEPLADDAFYWRSTLCRLPGLGVATTVCSRVHTRRTRGQIDSDDLVINITVAGKRIVRQFGREVVVAAGEAALTRSLEVASCDCDSGSQLINIRIPFNALAPLVSGLDTRLVRAIPADTEGLALLIRYVEMMHGSGAADLLANAPTQRLAVAHIYDLAALMLGAPNGAAKPDARPGTAAARLRAIKADIVGSADQRTLSVEAIAARHQVSVRYVHKLFEAEGMTFSRFVLTQRLGRAHRMMIDPRFASHTISSIAFACGFGDLSYFNRVFRQEFGATPTDLRKATQRQDIGQ